VAGGFALLTGWLEGRRRHREWLRDRRYAANLGFLTELQMQTITGSLDKASARRHASEVMLLGPDALLDPIEELLDAEIDGDDAAKRTARTKYLLAAQRVLGIRTNNIAR